MNCLKMLFKASFVAVMFGNVLFASAVDKINEGKIAFDNKELKKTKVIFKELLEENHESAISNYYFGRVLFEEKNFDEAIDYLKEAVEYDEENSEYCFWLAKAYTSEINNVNFISKGIYSSKAMSNLEKSIELDPANIEARQYLAMFLFRAPAIAGGDKDEAWKQAEKIFELDKEQGYIIKAQFYQIEEKYDLAIELFSKQIELNPNNTSIYYNIGLIYQVQKKFDEAFKNFQKAVEIDKTAYASLYQIGRNAVFSSKKLDEGIVALKDYIENAVPDGNLPSLDGAHWRLGSLYKLKGDKEKAREHFNMAIKLNPDSDDYSDALDALDE